MSTTLKHPFAPTDAERALIEAGMAVVDRVEWTTGPNGAWISKEQMDAVSTDPDVIAGARAMREWVARTCPDWCNTAHELQPVSLPRLGIWHERTIVRAEAASVTIQASYDDDDPTVEGLAQIYLAVGDGSQALSPTGARNLAAALTAAAEKIDAIEA